MDRVLHTTDYIALEDQYGAHNYHPLDVVIDHAEGVWVYDVEGKKYLDCLSGYSALSQGHCHPRIINALMEQAQRVTLTSRAFRNNQLAQFAQELCELTGFERMLPMNSGAEAIETAIKAARKWGYTVKGIPANQAEIITCSNNFHGRTTTIVTFSTETLYREGFGPFTPGFVTVPFGDIAALEAAITPNTAAFLVEPIQAEAGIIMPPGGYLRAAKELCEEHNVLFIADEIQTGLGRTGKLFAVDHENVVPDMLVLGKALSGGVYPVSAVVGNDEVLGEAIFPPGSHGSTFGGNPLGSAVAREALKVLIEEELVENSAILGENALERFRQIDSPYIKEVRGRGLLIGLELHEPARRFCEALREERVLCKETHENTIRFAPPLIIDQNTIDWAIDKFEAVLNV